MGDQPVGGGEDRGGGAVILFQTNELHVREIPAELMDILHPGAAPAVDRLVIIAHHEDLAGIAGQQPHPGVLNGIGILKLVHQDVAEALPVMGQQIGMVAP